MPPSPTARAIVCLCVICLVPLCVYVVSMCLCDGMFELPSAATTTSSSSGCGGAVAARTGPTALALAEACGRMCAREFDACRAPCARRSGPLWRQSGGTLGMSGGSAERRIWSPWLYRVVIHHILIPCALGCALCAWGAWGHHRTKSYLYTIVYRLQIQFTPLARPSTVVLHPDEQLLEASDRRRCSTRSKTTTARVWCGTRATT